MYVLKGVIFHDEVCVECRVSCLVFAGAEFANIWHVVPSVPVATRVTYYAFYLVPTDADFTFISLST